MAKVITTNPVSLGDEVQDIYTGYKGVAVGRTTWLYSCARILIRPNKLDKDGKPQEGEWFDETQVKVTRRTAPKISPQRPFEGSPKTGGPKADPKRPRMPSVGNFGG